jgi:hypothetical protein
MASISEPNRGEGRGATADNLDAETMDKIVAALQNLDNTHSDEHRLFEESRQKWEDIVKPLVDAISASERLTEKDFAIRINTRD